MGKSKEHDKQPNEVAGSKKGNQMVVLRGAEIRRLLSDEGVFWVGFDSTADSFTTPLFTSAEDLAVYLCQEPGTDDAGPHEWLKIAERAKTVVLTGSEVESVYQTADALHRSATVTNDQLWRLFNFYWFLEVTLLAYDISGQEFNLEFEERYDLTFGDLMCYVTSTAWRKHHPGVPSVVRAATAAEKQAVGGGLKQIMESSQLVGSNPKSAIHFVLQYRDFDFADKI